MNNRIVTAGLVIATAFCASLAWADDLASLIEQMRTGKTQLSTLKTQEDDLTATSQRDLKEFNVYVENFGQLEAQKKAKMDSFKKDAERRLKAADGMVNEWNSRCATDKVGVLSEAAYNACAASKTQVEPVVDGIRSGVQRDADAYQKKEIDPIDAAQQKQKKAMDEITLRIKERFARWEKLKKVSDALTAELERIRTILIDRCKSATTLESLKHCHSIGWDGARQDLPPL